jgi:hypothetical protein
LWPPTDGDAASRNGSAKDTNGAADDGFEFPREEIEPISMHESSLLDKLLKGAGVPLGSKPAMLGQELGAVLHLTIYLPTRKEMKIDVRVLVRSVGD